MPISISSDDVSSKRRSEEPLVKISNVKQQWPDEVVIVDDDDDKPSDNAQKSVEKLKDVETKVKNAKDEDSEDEEHYEVEEIVDYQYCKVSVVKISVRSLARHIVSEVRSVCWC